MPVPVAASAPTDTGTATVAFHGPRQAGIAQDPPAHAAFVAFTLPAGTDRRPPARMMRLLTLAAVLAVLAPGTPAQAHARLVAADPVRDARLARAPATVSLTFSARLNPDFTTIVVSDAAARRVPASAPVVDAATGTVRLTGPLANGLHTVAYRVVSVDGHTVQGSYTFTVADPALPTPGAAPPAGARARTAGSGGMPTGVLIGLAALGVLLAAGALFRYGYRRRRAVTRG